MNHVKVTVMGIAAAVSVSYWASLGAEAKPPLGGAPGPIKLHHVTGTHQCQSYENIGYTCAVETRDALDCTSGHQRLQMQSSCCHWYQGKMQTDGRSINYTPGRCSPLN